MFMKVKVHYCLVYLFPKVYNIFFINRHGVAGSVLQSPSLLILQLIQSVSHPFPPNLQYIITPKPWELGSWRFERIFTLTTCQMSGVKCPVSDFFPFFLQNGGARCRRACYQRGLPLLDWFKTIHKYQSTKYQSVLNYLTWYPYWPGTSSLHDL